MPRDATHALGTTRGGCECPTHHPNGRKVSARDRCTAKAIRCNGALAVFQDQRIADAKALVEATHRVTEGGGT